MMERRVGGAAGCAPAAATKASGSASASGRRKRILFGQLEAGFLTLGRRRSDPQLELAGLAAPAHILPRELQIGVGQGEADRPLLPLLEADLLEALQFIDCPRHPSDESPALRHYSLLPLPRAPLLTA